MPLDGRVDLYLFCRNQLRGLKDVPRIMIRVRKATASVNDWSNLSKSLAALFQLREACVQFDEDMRPAAEDVPSIFNQVKDEICPRIHNLEVHLHAQVVADSFFNVAYAMVCLEAIDSRYAHCR
jgi:DNA mismatch repair ATPase MutS